MQVEVRGTAIPTSSRTSSGSRGWHRWLSGPAWPRPLEWGDPTSWGFELCADDVRGFCDALGIARVGGDEVAATAERVYGGDSLSVTTEEWDRCWGAVRSLGDR